MKASAQRFSQIIRVPLIPQSRIEIITTWMGGDNGRES